MSICPYYTFPLKLLQCKVLAYSPGSSATGFSTAETETCYQVHQRFMGITDAQRGYRGYLL